MASTLPPADPLRALVAARYRDLLATADRIVHMDAQMRDVGARLTAASSVSPSTTNLPRRPRAPAPLVALHLLQSALTAARRTIARRACPLRAALLLVLARLLAQVLSSATAPPATAAQLLLAHRKRLAAQRRRVLAYADAQLAHASAPPDASLRALSAHALLTSATPRAALTHLLDARFTRLARSAAAPAPLLAALPLYARTHRDARALFPTRFGAALAALHATPLLAHADLRDDPDLALDLHAPWLPPDVRAFTPWLRTEALAPAEVAALLAAWARRVHGAVVGGVRAWLEGQSDAEVVLDARRRVLARFLACAAPLRADAHVQAAQSLRDAFAERLDALAEQAAQVPGLGLDDDDGDDDDDSTPASPPSPPPEIWTLASRPLDATPGSAPLRRAILDARHGRTPALRRATHELDAWAAGVAAFAHCVARMRAARWDVEWELGLEGEAGEADDDGDGDGDGDDEDEDAAWPHRLATLDPDRLTATLRRALHASVSARAAQITSASAASNPALRLRLWRELDARRRALDARLAVPVHAGADVPVPAPVVVPDLGPLLRALAVRVCAAPLEEYACARTGRGGVAVGLWEGSDGGTDTAPRLPVQPAPATWHFVAQLQRAMARAGPDLWDAAAVARVRGVVLGGLGGLDDEGGEDDGGEDDDDDERARRIQRRFDGAYLLRVLRPGESGGDADADARRLQRNVAAYWRRTYLLFGLLAGREDG